MHLVYFLPFFYKEDNFCDFLFILSSRSFAKLKEPKYMLKFKGVNIEAFILLQMLLTFAKWY